MADGMEQREADRLERAQADMDRNELAEMLADEHEPRSFADDIKEMAMGQMRAAQSMFDAGREVGYKDGYAKGYSEALDAALAVVNGTQKLAADLAADAKAAP